MQMEFQESNWNDDVLQGTSKPYIAMFVHQCAHFWLIQCFHMKELLRGLGDIY